MKLNQNNQGFTLIELLVAMIVFTIVISSVIALFGNVMKAQNEVLSQAQILNSASYATEYIAKALRMAKKDLTGNCIGLKNNYINIGGSSAIRFLNYEKKCQEFGLSVGLIYLRKSPTDSSAGLSAPTPLTASNLNVSKLSFVISGNSQDDDLQPKVAFTAEISEANKKLAPFRAQTTISQRDLDIPQ